MAETEAPTEQASTPSPGASPTKRRGNPQNLRPPWRKGQSGNPTGLTKDGQKVGGVSWDTLLEQALSKRGPGGLELRQALVLKWCKLALRGSWPHLQAILERKYPVPQDGQQGRTILEGLKLELHEGGATLTMGRATGQLPATGDADSVDRDSNVGGSDADKILPDAACIQLEVPPSEETPKES